MSRRITITLTEAQANRILDSLSAHFAGDTSEGDLTWTAKEQKSANVAAAIIRNALDAPAADTFVSVDKSEFERIHKTTPAAVRVTPRRGRHGSKYEAAREALRALYAHVSGTDSSNSPSLQKAGKGEE